MKQVIKKWCNQPKIMNDDLDGSPRNPTEWSKLTVHSKPDNNITIPSITVEPLPKELEELLAKYNVNDPASIYNHWFSHRTNESVFNYSHAAQALGAMILKFKKSVYSQHNLQQMDVVFDDSGLSKNEYFVEGGYQVFKPVANQKYGAMKEDINGKEFTLNGYPAYTLKLTSDTDDAVGLLYHGSMLVKGSVINGRNLTFWLIDSMGVKVKWTLRGLYVLAVTGSKAEVPLGWNKSGSLIPKFKEVIDNYKEKLLKHNNNL